MFSMLPCKVAAYTLSAALSLLIGDHLRAQVPAEHHRVQAVIPDLRTARQAHEVDLSLLALPGVLVSRTDFNTRNMLIEVSADCAISREQIQVLLLPYQLAITCYSRTSPGSHAFVPLNPRTCGHLPIVR